jgi:acetyl-CoA carboxylase biotin carboxyl carrier protein
MTSVKSEISGSVWKIMAKVGDKVAEEDTIMILESMKMEIPVLAPEDGVIKDIVVSEGDAINEGDEVATLE